MSTKRWIAASSDATELERSLLASGLDADPPADAEDTVWQRLAATLGGPLAPGVATTSSAASTAASVKAVTGVSALVMLGKGFALGVAVSLGLVGVARLESTTPHAAKLLEHAPQPSVQPLPGTTHVREPQSLAKPNPPPELPREPLRASFPEAASVTASLSVSPRAAPTPSLPAGSASVSQSHPAGTSSVAAFPVAEGHAPSRQAELERQSQLEEETMLLRRARAELRANRLAEAFATLEASREKFSLPELSQEREALLIELLFQSGQRASAVEKARRFLVQYPNSPHSAQVKSIARAETR